MLVKGLLLQIDALFKKRSADDSNGATRLKAQFLDEINTKFHGVIFVGATNHANRIDEAFLRRMEGKHLLLLPGRMEKMKLLNYTLKGMLQLECHF